MKKSQILTALVLIALIGVGLWLYRGADAKHLERQPVSVDVPDTFEK